MSKTQALFLRNTYFTNTYTLTQVKIFTVLFENTYISSVLNRFLQGIDTLAQAPMINQRFYLRKRRCNMGQNENTIVLLGDSNV